MKKEQLNDREFDKDSKNRNYDKRNKNKKDFKNRFKM